MKKPTHVRKSTLRTFRPCLESLENRLTPATYTVSSLADSGTGSLRAAIMSVNSDTTADEIDFSVAGAIHLASALPAITNGVKIDGTTAPGFASAPVVEIDNNGFSGLTLDGNLLSNFSLISLSIVNANGPGVTLESSKIMIIGNYIGLAADGSVAANSGAGVLVDSSSSDDTIGGDDGADRNVISGNGGGGIQLGSMGAGADTQDVTIMDNFIGVDPTGQAAAGNKGNGITVFTSSNVIGGNTSEANTIAFNSQAGVAVTSGEDNFIRGNSIFGNSTQGIDLQNGSNHGISAPQLSYAVESNGSTPGSVQVQVGGVLEFSPDSSIDGIQNATIEVFATLNGVPAGQGQVFVGSVDVTTNSRGFVDFALRNANVPASTGITFTATVTASVNTSEFSNSVSVGTNNQAYVANVYQLLLSRVPDPSSSFWVNNLNNGASPASVALGVEGSTEYLNDQVTIMYNLYLKRNPDTAGAQFFVSFLQTGGTFEQVAEELTASQEYFVLQGGTNQDFITGLYDEVLNRGPSNAEIAGWENALNNGASRLDVSSAFLTSQEYRTNLVQADYMTFLLRPADSGGLTTFVNALNAGATDQEVLAAIFGSPEGYQLWS